ncbi:YciI family protein [Micromonospora sp. NPDC049497]|uniref:YciI family protein n=1 Tax=Micromonospora sp. NPDC049497 TaxID=3364273 RepID=UPI00378F9375
MKYMIMMFGGLGETLATRSPEWISGMQKLMMDIDGELRENGELVASDALADPAQATTVRFHNGAPLPTDGPFAEVKESLAGFWIVDVSEERALEIASRAVAYIEFPMEVRRLMDHQPPPS